MAHSRVMAELSGRMWDMSDFFINTIGGGAHLSDALPTATRTTTSSAAPSGLERRVARVAMQSHIVGTVALFRDELDKPA